VELAEVGQAPLVVAQNAVDLGPAEPCGDGAAGRREVAQDAAVRAALLLAHGEDDDHAVAGHGLAAVVGIEARHEAAGLVGPVQATTTFDRGAEGRWPGLGILCLRGPLVTRRKTGAQA